jgi:hypothetical protein
VGCRVFLHSYTTPIHFCSGFKIWGFAVATQLELVRTGGREQTWGLMVNVTPELLLPCNFTSGRILEQFMTILDRQKIDSGQRIRWELKKTKRQQKGTGGYLMPKMVQFLHAPRVWAS